MAVCMEALELTGDQQRAFLKEACGTDATLLHEVRSLMGQGNTTIDAVWGKFEEVKSELSAPEGPGTELGPFTLESELGYGGMGTVYLASQSAPISRKVAVKVLREQANPDLLARFNNERQILASLNHPNIAGLYESGETAAGLPWFAMEYIAVRVFGPMRQDQPLRIEDRR